jgi:MoxR-like ATPase
VSAADRAVELERRLADLGARLAALRAEVRQSFLGQDEVVDGLVWTLIAGGHALIEGAPGLGKTTLVRALAAGLDLSFQRIQCTPDLMPGDVLGARILEEAEDGRRRFSFQRGPVFAHVLLADEINRATPRTQSALLEAMQERQVTVFGETHVLEEPFLVVATQNPIEMEGTYPLPEAQLDRFMAKIEVRSPGERELAEILAATTGASMSAPRRALARGEVRELQRLARELPATSAMIALAARLVSATDPRGGLASERLRRSVRWGASPRGGQAALLLAKARALAAGRVCVDVEDLDAVAVVALRHRLILSYEGEASRVAPDELVREAFAAAREAAGRS